jgi:hypothetical protein
VSSRATLPALASRSARSPSRRVLAALAAVAAIVALRAVVLVSRQADRADVAGCPFEQRWFTGDLHFWQELTFDGDGTGVWEAGGMDSDASHDRVNFAWTRDGASLSAVVDGETRTVGYEIRRREASDLCFLVLDGRFVPHEHQSTHWSDSDWR